MAVVVAMAGQWRLQAAPDGSDGAWSTAPELATISRHDDDHRVETEHHGQHRTRIGKVLLMMIIINRFQLSSD